MTGCWQSTLRGRWIFLVEDVFPILLMLEGIVHAFDCNVAARPETLAEAIRQARILTFDAAVLDIHVWGRTVYPVAQVLRDRDIPFAFATGQDIREMPAEWRAYPVIGKPYRTGAVGRALAAALRSHSISH